MDALRTAERWPAPLDLVGPGLIGLLLLLGLYRGLWWQVMRLAGVTAAVLVARAFATPLAARVGALFPDLEARTAHGVAWATLFLVGLLACALLGLLGQRVLEALKLGLANRVAGGLAGALTGLCVHVVLVVLFVQLAPPPTLGRYVVGTWSERLYGALGLRWPVVMASDAAHEVNRVLEEAPRRARAAEDASEDSGGEGPRVR